MEENQFLLVRHGSGSQNRIIILQETNEFGRGLENVTPLLSLFVSRNHCEIQLEDGIWMVYDRGSLNGTFVNDTKVSADGCPIKEGDLLGFGINMSNYLESPDLIDNEDYFVYKFCKCSSTAVNYFSQSSQLEVLCYQIQNKCAIAMEE